MKLLVINGPNLNMLGIREPEVYGHGNLQDLEDAVRAHCEARDVTVTFFQSNHEGALVDAIQQARGQVDALIINPAAYTHTSIALLDALLAVSLPAVEVHLSDPIMREAFRHHSFVQAACMTTIRGRGVQGYLDAVDFLLAHR